ncbi:uncharacterized protein RB166_008229 [Leptodactylus fuscus]
MKMKDWLERTLLAAAEGGRDWNVDCRSTNNWRRTSEAERRSGKGCRRKQEKGFNTGPAPPLSPKSATWSVSMGQIITHLLVLESKVCDGIQDLTVKDLKEIVNKVHCLIDKTTLRLLNKAIDKLTGDIVDPKGKVADFLNNNLCPVVELLEPVISNYKTTK